MSLRGALACNNIPGFHVKPETSMPGGQSQSESGDTRKDDSTICVQALTEGDKIFLQ